MHLSLVAIVLLSQIWSLFATLALDRQSVPLSLSKRISLDVNHPHAQKGDVLNDSSQSVLAASDHPSIRGPTKYERRMERSQQEDTVVAKESSSSDSDSDYEEPRQSAFPYRGASQQKQGAIHEKDLLRWYQLKSRTRGHGQDNEPQRQEEKQSQKQGQQEKKKKQGSIRGRPGISRRQQQPSKHKDHASAPPHTIVYRHGPRKRAQYYRLYPNTKIQSAFRSQNNPPNLQRRCDSRTPDSDPPPKHSQPLGREHISLESSQQKIPTYKANPETNQATLDQLKTSLQKASSGQKISDHISLPKYNSPSPDFLDQHIVKGVKADVAKGYPADMKASVGKGYSADIKADVAKGFPADMKANVAKGYPADIKASFTVAKGYPADIQNSVLLDMPMGLGMAPAPQKGLSRARYFLRNLRNRRNRKDNNPPKSPDPSQKHLGPRAVQSKEGPDDSPSSTSHPLSKSLPPPFFYSPSGFYSPPGHPSFVWPRLIPGPVNRPKGPQQFHHMVRPRPFIHGPFFPPEQSHYRKQVFGASDYPIRPLLEPGPFPKHGPLPPRPKNVFAPPPGFGHSLPLVPPSGLQQPGSDRRSSTSQNTKAPPSPSTPEHDSPAYGAERGRKRRKYEK